MLKFLLLSLFSSVVLASSTPVILLVHSYHLDKYKWSASIQEGVVQRLSKEGLVVNKDYIIKVEELDVHKYSKTIQKKKRAKIILNKIKTIKPDYVITTDDDALELVGLQIKDRPVIFNGINKDISFYFGNGVIESKEKPGANVSGIYQTIYFKQSLELLKKISPKVSRYAFIGDNSNTSKSLYRYLQTIIPNIGMEFVDSHVSNSKAEWKKALKSWEGKVDVILTGTPVELRDIKGELLPATKAFRFLVDSTSAIVLGNWVFQVEYGALLSMADSGHQQGWYSGEYLIRVMKGEKVGNLPIITPKEGIPTINLNELKKRKIKLSRKMRWNIFQHGVVISEDI